MLENTESVSEITEKGDNFKFQLNGFRKFSATFVFLIIISLLTSFGYMLFLAFPALIFVMFPSLYRKIGVMRLNKKLMTILSSKRAEKLSYVPGISISGRWFIEKDSEIVQFKSVRTIIHFIFSHWIDFFLIPIGLMVLIIRVLLFFVPDLFSSSSREFVDLILEGNFLFLFIAILPLFYAYYYPIVWSWYDAEIKIADWRESSKGKSREVTQLYYAANSLRNIISIFAGFNAVSWVYNLENNILGERGSAFGAVIGTFLVLFIFIGGIGIFQGIMYYRSGIHEIFVNELREFIYNKHTLMKQKDELDLNDGISIYQTTIIPVDNLTRSH